MCSIADRLLAAVFAAAEENSLAGVSGVLDRCYACVFVAAIAERLITALAAGAPEIGFALFNLDRVGGFLNDDRCCHCFNP